MAMARPEEASLPGDEIVATSEAEHDRDDDAHTDADQTHVTHEIGHLVLEGWFFGVHGLKCFANLPQLGPESSASYFGDALSGNDQRAGVDSRKVLASRTLHFGLAIPLFLADRDRLTGQE